MTTGLVVLLWQVVLVGGWVLARRLRQLELTRRPPCSAQVGELREQVVELRTDQAYDGDEQSRRLREMEVSTSRVEAEVRVLVRQHEALAHAVMTGIARLEGALDLPDSGVRGAALASNPAAPTLTNP
ncbi:MAG: hypothetical protein ACRD2C_16515 [Acidimicrobiales bacterium]